MIAATIGALALTIGACAPACVPAPAHRAPCAGTVITVHGDDPTGCDVRPPQTITVIGITRAHCDDLGGTFTAPDECERVDY